jgi:hypothetical protein
VEIVEDDSRACRRVGWLERADQSRPGLGFESPRAYQLPSPMGSLYISGKRNLIHRHDLALKCTKAGSGLRQLKR